VPHPRVSTLSRSALAIVSGLLCAPGCAPSGALAPSTDDASVDAGTQDSAALDPHRAARQLAQWLEGRFDSSAQATRDRRYFDVTLAVCSVSAPSVGATALYVEQAMRGRAPYRQRLYVISAGADGARIAESRVFEFVDPASVTGLCDREGTATIEPEAVIERAGCTVTLVLEGDRFVGSTSGHECLSTLMGASYATTQITLDAQRLESWDRGFDSAGRQVWGATAGPYQFERRTPLVPLR
jgi:hypothetical protein